MDKTKEQLLEEVLDPNKVSLYCSQHLYFGPGKDKQIRPTSGCAKCWQVYFLLDYANTPPDKRNQRVAELEEVIHHLVESVEQGTFDYKPLQKAEFEYTKED